MLIALVLESDKISAGDLRLIAGAVDYQMHAHVAPAWGMLPPKIYATRQGVWVPGSARLHLVDALPESPDALGYHTEAFDGEITGKIGLEPILSGGSVFRGAQSVSAVVSHEVIELFLDAFVDFWADAPDGYCYPLEGCDAVQGDTYTAGGADVHVSDFLLKSWFDPLGKAPFDYLGRLQRPFSLAKGGYTVRRHRGTGTTEIFGARPKWKHSLRGVSRYAGHTGAPIPVPV